jgi:RimJ/RimL family protein N-acetyltransferase
MLPADKHPKLIRDYLESNSGRPTRLRAASEADSEFILSVRLDPNRNSHISSTSSSLQGQQEWMQKYQRRHDMGQEAYFIIQHDGIDVGTVRLYDYRPAEDSFCWGSWVIKPGTQHRAAFATPLLVYDLGFSGLGFSRSHFDIRQANSAVWKFEEMLGAELIHEDETDRRYVYSKLRYFDARERLLKLIEIA